MLALYTSGGLYSVPSPLLRVCLNLTIQNKQQLSIFDHVVENTPPVSMYALNAVRLEQILPPI